MKKEKIPESELVLRKKVWPHYGKGNYLKALTSAEALHKSSPDDLFFLYAYASLLGDYSQSLSKPKSTRLKRKAVYLLRGLSLRLRNADPKLAYLALNELYYHSGNFLKQFRLGVREVENGTYKGYFSQGVGALYHGRDLILRGRTQQGLDWCHVSVNAWQKLIRESRKRKLSVRWDYHWFLSMAYGFVGSPELSKRHKYLAAKVVGKSIRSKDFLHLDQCIRAVERCLPG